MNYPVSEPPTELNETSPQPADPPRPGGPRLLRHVCAHRISPLCFAALAIALALPSLGAGWLADDDHIRLKLLGLGDFMDLGRDSLDLFRFTGRDAVHNAHLMDVGVWPWWTVSDIQAAFYRPLTSLTHWLDFQAWPNHAWPMHAHSLLWFGALVCSVGWLHRRFTGAVWIAGLATLLYAIDDARAVPAAWMANRNSLLTVLFGVLAIGFHDRWRRDRWSAGAALGPVMLLLSLLSKEAGVATCAYLAAHALFLDQAKPHRRILALLPYALLVIAWRLQWSQMGYGISSGVAIYIDPINQPLAFAGAVLQRGPLYLLSQFLFPPSDLYLPAVDFGFLWIYTLIALALLAALAAAVLPRLNWSPTTRFWTLGMLLSVPPICAGFPGDRLLGFVGLGGSALLANFFATLWGWIDSADNASKPTRKGRTLPRHVRMASLVLIGVHFGLAPLGLLVRSAYPMGPPSYIEGLLVRIPDDTDLTGKTVVIVTAPVPLMVGYLPERRALAGLSLPQRTRALAPHQSAGVEVTRTDTHTLTIRPAEGFMNMSFDRLARNLDHPFHLNQQVKLAGMTVTVTKLTDDNRPAQAQFRFDQPLEHPDLFWIYWNADRFSPFILPPQGQCVTLGKN
ncbi:MAG: hypothetical protein ACE5GE_09300 [Phycisphaerae bacterium]